MAALHFATALSVNFPARQGTSGIGIYRSVEDLEELENDWRGLEVAARRSSVFGSFDWCRHMLEVLGRGRGGFEAVIATFRRGGRLVALWPLARQRRTGVKVLTSLGAPFDQYSEILIAEGENATELVLALARDPKQSGIADGMVLRKVRTTGDLHKLVLAGADSLDEGAQAPRIVLDPGAPFEAYLATVNAKTRKNLRNYGNRLSRLGTIGHRVRSGGEIGTDVVDSFEARRGWLDAQGLSSTAFRDPRFAEVVASFAQHAGRLGLIAFALTLDGRPVAVQWGFIYQGCYHAFMSARDPAYEEYSAGRLHLKHVIEACHARGIGDLDLMVPAVPYKMSWTDRADSVVDLIWPWTTRGHLALTVMEQRVRPQLKLVAGRLPQGVRQRLFRIVNR